MTDEELLQRITTNPKVMVGKPVIRGTRLTVELILGLLAHGEPAGEILREYAGLTEEDIHACLLYAAALSADARFAFQTQVAGVRESSEYLLALPDDWDGAGAKGFAAVGRATGFLASLSQELADKFNVSVDPPRILPAGEGTIDLHWKTASYELLVNIPADPRQDISYYGDNKQGNMPIENSCHGPGPDRRLVAWLSLLS
jgi:uncharacterized protein (DUF433 family)